MSSNPGPGLNQVWMGGVFKPYMTESFILNAFQKMGEKPVSVKFFKKKKSGEPPTYCIVQFQSEEEAKKAVSDLNGKIIPNSVPSTKFLLSIAGPGVKLQTPKYSVWLTDLSADVDDNSLFKTFSSRYQSVILAKVILDMTGFSKGIAHLKFLSEDEQKNCLNHMNGFKGLGTKPLKVSPTLPPGLWNLGSTNSSQDPHAAFEKTYWQSYAAWQNSFKDPIHNSFAVEITTSNIIDTAMQKENELELIDHNTKLDIDNWNREVIQRDYNMWDALECSKWLPLSMNE